MKFGKTHQVPECTQHYMGYKELKKQIKEIVQSIQNASESDPLNNEKVQTELASFFFKLDRNIEKVESFYNFQFSEYERRFKRVSHAIASSHKNEKIEFDKEEFEEVMGVLIELRGNFRNLKWFGELNKRGFIKILKKLDKKAGTNKQMYYLDSRIFPSSFANEGEILAVLDQIHKYLSDLSPRADELVVALNEVEATPAPERGYATLTMGKYSQCIGANNGAELIKKLVEEFRSPVLAPAKLMISLLNKSALAQSFDCIDKLLGYVQTLSDTSDISGRNFFHHHIITLGKQTAKKRAEAQAAAEKAKKNNEKLLGVKIERDMSLLPAAAPDSNLRLVGAYGPDGINSNDSPSGLEYILKRLPISLRPSLLQRDNYKRAPLHYAAQFGLKQTTSTLIECLKKWGQWDSKISLDNPEKWGDTEFLTPVQLALVGDHPKTLKVLIDSVDDDVLLHNKALLLLAARLKSQKLLEVLLQEPNSGIDINYNGTDSKETALFISAKLNSVDCVKYLLEKGADTEVCESTFGWTPIFVAAAEGFGEVVDLLIKAGAVYSKEDLSGWLPMEHSSLRGHLDLADKLRPSDYDPLKLAKSSNVNKLLKKTGLGSNKNTTQSDISLIDALKSQSSTSSVDKVPENLAGTNGDAILYKQIRESGHPGVHSPHYSHATPKPIKSFGHSHLKPRERLVLLSLGTMDLRDNKDAIQLNRVPVSKAHSTQLDTALSVSISCKQLRDPPVSLDLPLDDNHGSATDPINFKFINTDPKDATIYFDIVPTYSYDDDVSGPNVATSASSASSLTNGSSNGIAKRKVLGRAIALLGTAYSEVGKNMASLHKVVTVPIIESDTLEELGTVRFEVREISSFSHPSINNSVNDSYWKTLITTRVIGHRGLGKNVDSRNSLQLGENTVESFIAAASLGASYVEFDVQLTKDLVPVIYHDFLVAESGVDIPMHKLTAEQFLNLSDHRPDQEYFSHKTHIKRNRTTKDFSSSMFSVDDEALLQNRKYEPSYSMLDDVDDKDSLSNLKSANTSNDDISSVFDERMKLTRTYKQKKFKGNSRGTSIASSFVTLEDLFKKLPETVGFNIECKYPMLEEAQREDFEEIVIELNTWVDVILKTVYDNKNSRNIIFSSFHPDVCIYLTLKQPSIPVLFLTEGGTCFMPDARASSLQAAIRFAKKWDLLGIVSAAYPIVQCPRLTSIVKSNGLVCFTYGVLNNDPENAKLEVEAGVDAVIVDKVLAVRKGLTK